MPRVSRTEVRFRVDGRDYAARFDHTHFDPPTRDGTKKIQHRTVCILEDLTDVVEYGAVCLSTGEAKCSAKDEYNWKVGVKLAVQRAIAGFLLSMGIHPDTVEGRAAWGLFNSAFFGELRIPSAELMARRIDSGNGGKRGNG